MIWLCLKFSPLFLAAASNNFLCLPPVRSLLHSKFPSLYFQTLVFQPSGSFSIHCEGKRYNQAN